MKPITKRIVRRVAQPRRDLVVMLLPGPHGTGEIEVRELGRRTGYRVSIAQLFSILAARGAGLYLYVKRSRL